MHTWKYMPIVPMSFIDARTIHLLFAWIYSWNKTPHQFITKMEEPWNAQGMLNRESNLFLLMSFWWNTGKGSQYRERATAYILTLTTHKRKKLMCNIIYNANIQKDTCIFTFTWYSFIYDQFHEKVIFSHALGSGSNGPIENKLDENNQYGIMLQVSAVPMTDD